MGHDRKPHTRRYPKRRDGTRRPGMVSVNGSQVNPDIDGDGGGACGCCLLILIGLFFGAQWLWQTVVEMLN